ARRRGGPVVRSGCGGGEGRVKGQNGQMAGLAKPLFARWPNGHAAAGQLAADSQVTASRKRGRAPWSACGAPGSAEKGAVMSVKHLRTALAALALVTVTAVPAHGDPWGKDHARGLNPTPSPLATGPDEAARAAASADANAYLALHARSVALNQRYGIGIGTTSPLVTHQGGSDDGFDWSTAGIGAAVILVAAGGAAV